jgi:hypothetical protein
LPGSTSGRGFAVVLDGIERGQRTPVMEIANSPQSHDEEQCCNGRAASATAALPDADLLAH